MQGKLLEKNKKKQFYQFLWRPHPPTLLSEKQLDDIKKRMKEYRSGLRLGLRV